MIRIGGMLPLTTIDFPGKLAAVLFLQGCPWRCGYCHNPELLPARGERAIAWERAVAFLRRRRGLLDGVVFSGGEPTLQPGLGGALRVVRELGFATALHTGGMYPLRLARLLPQLDWVGLDIKAPPARHAAITGRRLGAAAVWDALDWLLDSGVDYECRTTWHPDLYPEPELHALGRELARRGVRRWVVQECRLDPSRHAPWTPPDGATLGEGFADFQLRRA
ncbi:anaerobic ribonucleoside-triphosphate reductase activating protein [Pseudoxanthomonas broegbernensis]|uniref:Anaerobic ribonucleoside-triphosphate reductase activating protein n=1 Tax=Pseudoxanthomonas broegbernensis TaxID=83619 RepID=A0A7V8GNJ8_9GAMM|nr:anaerobic ribonucleoside-triphosphate reductase activating protein [Pseudoxanthomonas broegbernensis]KAF1687165.1 anaerobic ribonucleoside-triphosphate reductase activating protein [Pseudoxanthomonas broegbernensis]MBB6065857.1 pyruvate formate lyase activating enzyme [Pseudoxanthomonas broegbernensis]